ncbi:hypothetical protein M3J09_007716 [Ascochyta lentis]
MIMIPEQDATNSLVQVPPLTSAGSFIALRLVNTTISRDIYVSRSRSSFAQ